LSLGLSEEWLKAYKQQREKGTREVLHGDSLSYIIFSEISGERRGGSRLRSIQPESKGRKS
jgi:hypothetical protein